MTTRTDTDRDPPTTGERLARIETTLAALGTRLTDTTAAINARLDRMETRNTEEHKSTRRQARWFITLIAGIAIAAARYLPG